MDFMSSGYYSSGGLIHDSHALTFIETNEPVEESTESAELVIPFSSRNFNGTLPLKDDQTTLASAPEGDCVRFQLSPLSMSPSEYGELPAPKPTSLPTVSQPSTQHFFLERPHSSKRTVTIANLGAGKWSPTTAPDTTGIVLNAVDVSPPPLISSLAQESSPPDYGNAKTGRTKGSNVPSQGDSGSPNPVNVLHHFAPQIHSTALKRSPRIAHPAYDTEEEDEDTSVYCLAAKFLANEQEYSLRLEEQIDSHLAVLENQIGFRSATVT